MLAIIIVAGGLYGLAKKRGMNAILWAIIGVAAWFGGQFIAGVILGLTNPQAAYDQGTLYAWSFGGAVGTSLLAFAILEIVYRNKQGKVQEVSDDIMDDSTFEEL